MKRGDIVLIKYPFTDFSTLKVRPALVISSDEFNKQGEDAVFMCISATPREPKKSDIKIESSNPEFAQTGLRRDSVFRVAKVVILKNSLANATDLIADLKKELQVNLQIEMGGLMDITAPDYLQVQIREDGKVVWIPANE